MALAGIIQGIGGEAPFVEKGRQTRRREAREDVQDQMAQEELGLRKQQLGIQRMGVQQRLAEIQRRLQKDQEWKTVGTKPLPTKDGGWAWVQFQPDTGEMRKIPAGGPNDEAPLMSLNEIEGAKEKTHFFNTQQGIAGVKAQPDNKFSAFVTPLQGYPPGFGSEQSAGSPEDIPFYAESLRQGNMEFSGVPQRLRGGTLRYMQTQGMAKGRKMTALEQRQLDDTRKLQPSVSRLKQYIEDNGLRYANDWGDKAAAFKRFAQYSLGFKPTGDPLGDAAAPTIAAVTVMATAPWTAGRQGKYLFDQIQQHVPQMSDTPAQMYNKLGVLQNIIDNNEYMLTIGREGEFGRTPNGRELSPREINQLPPPPED